MQSAWRFESRKYLPIAQAAYGEMYCIGAGSEAEAATTIGDSIAPAASRSCPPCAIDDGFWPIALYIQMRSLPLLLMIVSSATAVLPVWRSPMMSSRCPRPIGIIESMALSTGDIGHPTDLG